MQEDLPTTKRGRSISTSSPETAPVKRSTLLRACIDEARKNVRPNESFNASVEDILKSKMRDPEVYRLIMDDAVERVVQEIVGDAVRSANEAIRINFEVEKPTNPSKQVLRAQMEARRAAGWLDMVVEGYGEIRNMTSQALRSAAGRQMKSASTMVVNAKFWTLIAARNDAVRPDRTVGQNRISEAVLRDLRVEAMRAALVS